MTDRFNLFPAIAGEGNYTGTTIGYFDLIQRIRTPNDLIDEARFHGKGSTEYDRIKTGELLCFSPNSFTPLNHKTNEASSNIIKESTGYIYLDLDFYIEGYPVETMRAEALLVKERLAMNKHIALCWLSLSETGVGALVPVKKCYGKVQFDFYWHCLNLLFGMQVDPNTCRWNQFCVLSYDPDVFVNEFAIPIDEYFPYWIRYTSYLPFKDYRNINEPILLTTGRPYIRVDINKYKSGISEGNRNNVLGHQTAKLIIVNQGLSEDQILYHVLKWNQRYCKPALPESEVVSMVKNNYDRWSDYGSKDISQFYHKKKGCEDQALKRVWFSPFCRLTNGEKQLKRLYLLGQGREWTEQAIRKAIDQLKKGRAKITKET